MPGLEGTTLGRYRLKQKLGRGGMSEVYLASDERMHRDVAIKVVSGSHAEYAERFKRETEALGNLQHDHILPAYDYGEQGPYQYLVMPYESHGTLSDMLQNGPLALEHAGELLTQIASALDYAHEHGILHRDIKPSNILLRDDYYTYLADFGLVKAMEGQDDHDLTQTGILLGTPEYMAPELSEGPANIGTDLYALAILLYQMITGRVPFSGDTPISVYFKQLREHPLPPSYVNRTLSSAVDQVLMKALDKDPRRRYTTAAELTNSYLAAVSDLDDMPSLYETSEMKVENSPELSAHPSMQERKLFLAAEPLLDPSPAAVQPISAPVAPVIPATPEKSQAFNEPTVQMPPPQFSAPAPVSPMPPMTPSAPMRSSQVVRRSARRLGRHRRLMTGIVTGVLFLIFVSMFLLILALSRQNAPAGQAAQTGTAGTGITATTNGATGTAQAGSTAGASGTSQAQAQATQQAGTATAGAATATTGVAATATAAAQATQQAIGATATAATGGTPILDDPLTGNTNGRWPNDGNACSFINGSYHVLVHQTDFFQPCVSNETFDNAAIEINVSLLSGSDAGLVFRANGDQFYDFEINDQGQFFFRRHDAGKGGVYTYIIPETKSSAISGNGQSNSLLIIAGGSDFKLFINGTFVGERQDGTYSSGQIGVAAGTLNPTSSAEGSFSNLKVYKI